MSIIHTLYNQLKEFYEPMPNAQGIIQMVIEGNPELNHYYHFHQTIAYNPGISSEYQAQISLTLLSIEAILKNSETFDPLNPEYSRSIKFKGDFGLIEYLIQLLKRPSLQVKSIINNVRSKNYSEIDHVRNVENATPHILLKAIADSQPLRAIGLIKWDMISWSLEDLESKFGNVQLRENVLSGKVEYLSDYIRELKDPANKRLYTNGALLPSGLSDYFTLPFFDNFYFYAAQIWLGKNGDENKPVTRLHCDFGVSFLSQIWGKKKIYLYSPDQHEFVYPMKCFNTFLPCHADPSKSAHEKYPRFSEAKHLEVLLHPGDLLIIPTGWYHCVWATGNNFSVSRTLREEIALELYNHQAIL